MKIKNKYFFAAALVLSLLALDADAQTWTPPTSAPPDGNASAPINVSNTAQTKVGGLLLNTGGATNGLIVQSGNVGVGATSPSAKLHVLVPTYTPGLSPTIKMTNDHGDAIVLESYTNNTAGSYAGEPYGGTPRILMTPVAGGSWNAMIGTTNNTGLHLLTNATRRMTVLGNGNVGIGLTNPAYKLDVSGAVQATIYYYSSDRSLKKNVEPLEGVLNKVLSLEGVSFEWRDGGKKSIGLIAQDVERVYPEIVSTSENGLKSVEYGNLVAPLIESIKDQQEQIESLKREIKSLREDLNHK